MYMKWREWVFQQRKEGKTIKQLDDTKYIGEGSEYEEITYSLSFDVFPHFSGEEVITITPRFKDDDKPEMMIMSFRQYFKAEEWKGTDYYKICDKIEKKTRKNLSGKYSFLFFCDLFFQSNFYFNTNVEFWIEKDN